MRAWYWMGALVLAMLALWAYEGALYEQEMREDVAYELSTQLL